LHGFFEKESEMQKAPTKPVKVFRFRGVSAAIFENHSTNEGRESTYYKVNLQRTYKDGNDFKHTSHFNRDDIPVARHVLEQAWSFILETEASANNGA
jgi:hypothetical protein